ncbi:MAG TPA: lysylphosphatidylglycerol synthase transmembrane domain-containing protein [Nitrososphaeraceae archaeon]|nr:lysylphosphatidylglycerol synthase transmembrane domain-containing protein [Nitrososphaeraceae archaeon]
MKWRLVAIAASVVPFLFLFILTPVSPEDVFSVGVIPFICSVGAVMVRILLQAYRFRYFIKHFIGPNLSSTGKIMEARMAGEFVTQTTPSYVGGEIVRIAWLIKNGVSTGDAAWVATTEIIADVFAGTILAFIAGALALFHGGTFIGIVVILVTIPTFSFWFLVVLFSAHRNIQLPHFATRLLQRFLSTERSLRIVTSTNIALSDLCKMSRTHFKSRKSVKVFSVGIAMTFVAFLFQGVSFFVLANAVHEHIGLLESFMATSASTALATLPITIGGSGLAELGIWAYISNLGGIPHFADILNDSQLSVVIAWRIATYHIPLVIMWICLMKITIGKGSITIRTKDDKTSDDGNNIGTNGEIDTESPKIYSTNESPENSSHSSLSPSSSYSQSNDDPLHKPGSYKHSFSSGHPPRTPSDTPEHLDTISKKDTVDSIKNDNKQDNLKKNDKTDDSENGKD